MSELPSQQKPKERFSVRVPYYVKHRPAYPPELLTLMETEMGLTPQSVIADIGSGTGLLAEMFLKHSNLVYGVEPNREMREAGEQALANYPNFRSVEGAAEATTLPDACADFITAGQAFHWFEIMPTKREFARILRPGGFVVLAWNRITTDTSPFMRGYREVWNLISSLTTPEQKALTSVSPENARDILWPAGHKTRSFANRQVFDWEGIRGRYLSESYAPLPDDPRYESAIALLRRHFDANQENGRIVFHYDTRVYYGRLKDE